MTNDAVPAESSRGADPADETRRLAALDSYDILDTSPESAFDELAELAARLLGAPIALISLVDSDRQWFKSRVGLDLSETHRDVSFCSLAIAEPPDTAVFVVPDALADPAFAANPLVTGAPGIRFYAGAPIRSPDGYALGTLCVIGTEPRGGLDDDEADLLAMLARHVGQQLEHRRAARQVALSESRLRALVDNASDIILVLAADGTVNFVSDVVREVLGRDPDSSVGSNALDLLHPDDAELVLTSFAETSDRPGLNVPLEFRVAHADGSWVPVEAVANNRLDDPAVRGIVLHVRDVRVRKETEERVQRGERALAEAQRVARMGSWEWDLQTDEMVWSEGMYRLLGLDARTTAPSTSAWRETLVPEERDWVTAQVARAQETGEVFSFRRRMVQPSGEVRVVQTQGEFDLDAQGRAVRLRSTVVDVTDMVMAEQALEEERSFLRAVLDSLDEGIVACDGEGRLNLFNPATERFHGLTAANIAPEAWSEHYDLYNADGSTLLATDDIPLLRALRDGRVDGAEMVIAPKRGERRLVRCNGRAIFGATGARLGAVVAMHDITRQRLAETALRHLADHDVLTDLPNRSVFSNRLDAALHRSIALAVIFIDLDDFKRINDEHGHNVGDEVLVTTASRLRAAVKEGDTAARIGGDEFVVLCCDLADEADAGAIADRLRSILSRPVMTRGVLLQVRASVGFAVPGPGPMDGENLLVRADHAMYADKAARRA